jgi:hypothetical protein
VSIGMGIILNTPKDSEGAENGFLLTVSTGNKLINFLVMT